MPFTAVRSITGMWLALACVLLMAPEISAKVMNLQWDAPTTDATGGLPLPPLLDLSHYRVYV